MNVNFQPVLLPFGPSADQNPEWTEETERYLRLLSENLALSEVRHSLPQVVEPDTLLLLFTNDTDRAEQAIAESGLAPEQMILMGCFTENDFVGFLERTGIAGLVTSSALQKWSRKKTQPEWRVTLRAGVDYGLMGRKEAFNPDLFDETFFNAYASQRYGHFSPLNWEDQPNLEGNLVNYAQAWLRARSAVE